ncbi:MAG: hypothetical protein ACI8Y4_003059 [Candidatus Poriferisodalaceae bacterium]|jgi:hypothetical protein
MWGSNDFMYASLLSLSCCQMLLRTQPVAPVTSRAARTVDVGIWPCQARRAAHSSTASRIRPTIFDMSEG